MSILQKEIIIKPLWDIPRTNKIQMKKICVLLELSNSIFKRQNKTNMSQQERCCYNKNDVVNPLLRSEDPLGISKFDAPKPPSFALNID
jgi:hypothetical protein